MKKIMSAAVAMLTIIMLVQPVLAEEALWYSDAGIEENISDPVEVIEEDASEAGAYQISNTELYPGMYGEDVMMLQQALYELGFLTVWPDGSYGNYTVRAVKKFQMYNSMYMTGTADADVLSLINSGNAQGFYNLAYGADGWAVNYLQYLLTQSGYPAGDNNGYFGDETYKAVLAFQQINGLPSDGIAGRLTLECLLSDHLPYVKPDISDLKPHAPLNFGMYGEDVIKLQNRLSDLGYLTVSSDGWFGNHTVRALKAFQMYNCLNITGRADSYTLDVMFSDDAEGFSELKLWSTGKPVYGLQTQLSQLGYLAASPDGGFGNMTEQAVKIFQNGNGLTVNGSVGRETVDKLLGDPLPYVESMEIPVAAAEPYAVQLARQKLDELGWDLYAAYKWSADIPYTHNYTGVTVYESAEYGFTYGEGDCIVKASTFCLMARLLGYNCVVINGQVPYRVGGYGEHAWTEIDYNGSTYVCDPQFEGDEHRNGYMIYYGQSGTWRYVYGYIMSD